MSENESEKMSFDEELRKCILAVPFVPYDIVTTSGDRYEIRDNVQVAIGGSGVGVYLPKSGFQLIRRNQIVAIHVHESVSKAKE